MPPASQKGMEKAAISGPAPVVYQLEVNRMSMDRFLKMNRVFRNRGQVSGLRFMSPAVHIPILSDRSGTVKGDRF